MEIRRLVAQRHSNRSARRRGFGGRYKPKSKHSHKQHQDLPLPCCRRSKNRLKLQSTASHFTLACLFSCFVFRSLSCCCFSSSTPTIFESLRRISIMSMHGRLAFSASPAPSGLDRMLVTGAGRRARALECVCPVFGFCGGIMRR